MQRKRKLAALTVTQKLGPTEGHCTAGDQQRSLQARKREQRGRAPLQWRDIIIFGTRRDEMVGEPEGKL